MSMSETEKPRIYTIGHSNHTLDEFIISLRSFGIKNLVDIRRFPGSRKFPHFNKENLARGLKESGLHYLHLEGLGGRRKAEVNSKNSRWRNVSFRGYADYMETADFETAIRKLEDIAFKQPTAYMCSEAVWWRCHRALVSDYLKAKGWLVLHIMSANKFDEHPYTSPAKVVDGRVFYSDDNLFS